MQQVKIPSETKTLGEIQILAVTNMKFDYHLSHDFIGFSGKICHFKRKLMGKTRNIVSPF